MPDDGALSTVSAAEGGCDSEAEEMEEMEVEETRRAAWAWVVARQLMLLYETSLEVAYSALGCQGESEKDKMNALVEALLAGARTALDRLGRARRRRARILGGGVVNRFRTRLGADLGLLRLGELGAVDARQAAAAAAPPRAPAVGDRDAPRRLRAHRRRRALRAVSSDVSLDHASPPPSRQRSRRRWVSREDRRDAEKDATAASPLVPPTWRR